MTTAERIDFLASRGFEVTQVFPSGRAMVLWGDSVYQVKNLAAACQAVKAYQERVDWRPAK